MNTNIYSYLETSCGQSSNLFLNVAHFLTPVLIIYLWQLKTIVFLHWCLICAVLLIVFHILTRKWVFKTYVYIINAPPWTDFRRRYQDETWSELSTLDTDMLASNAIYAHLTTLQLRRSTGSKSTHLPSLCWPLGHKARPWLPPFSYFRIHWSIDVYIKAPFCSQFYIKYPCLYYRYLESEKPSSELEILDPR